MTKSTIHCLYLTKLCKWWFSSYPTGSFGGNQLLDCSSGLSPLYSTQTSDLHVSIVSRSSTRVSSGFNQFKYSSQSFGSQHNNLSPLQSRRIHKISNYEGFVFTKQSAFLELHVCYYTRLLGSCFKTNERWHHKISCQENLETCQIMILERSHISLFQQISRSISLPLVECFSPFLHSTYTLLVFYIIFSLRSFISPYAVSDFKDTYSFP